MTRSTRVLFVCTGNICRSAFAEVQLRGMLTSNALVDVASAGTSAVVGSGMEPAMSREAAQRGLDASAHRARQLNGRILKDADLVLVFEQMHLDWISAEHPECLVRAVSLGSAARLLRDVPRRSQLTAGELLMVMQRRGTLSDETEDWIEDPYLRGRAAAARAASRIEEAITVLVERVSWGAPSSPGLGASRRARD